MEYPVADPDSITFFHEHGYLVVRDAVPELDLDELEGYMNLIVDDPQKYLSFDWAWSEDETRAAHVPHHSGRPAAGIARNRTRRVP